MKLFKRLGTNCIDNLEPMHISNDVKSHTYVYDAYRIMVSISIDSNYLNPSLNASELKIGRFAKSAKLK